MRQWMRRLERKRGLQIQITQPPQPDDYDTGNSFLGRQRVERCETIQGRRLATAREASHRDFV